MNKRILDLCTELQSIAHEMMNLRIKKKSAKSIGLPLVLGSVVPNTNSIMSALGSTFGKTIILQNIDEHSVMKFFEAVGQFLGHISNNPSSSFSFEYIFREVLRLISQVCPIQHMLFEEYVKMSGPSIEDASKYLSSVLIWSRKQRDCLKLYRHELLVHQEFVTVMTEILDEQDRLIQVLLARIQNAITV